MAIWKEFGFTRRLVLLLIFDETARHAFASFARKSGKVSTTEIGGKSFRSRSFPRFQKGGRLEKEAICTLHVARSAPFRR